MLDKTNLIRFLDVILIGPLMIYGSTRMTGLKSPLLMISGIGTILYNGYNLLQNVTAGGQTVGVKRLEKIEDALRKARGY